jgi:hypothetical protein
MSEPRVLNGIEAAPDQALARHKLTMGKTAVNRPKTAYPDSGIPQSTSIEGMMTNDTLNQARPIFPLSPAAIQRLRAHDVETGRTKPENTTSTNGETLNPESS